MKSKLLTEEWKPIEGYEGYYEVSSFGRIRSLPRYVIKDNKGNKALKKGKIMKLGKGGTHPYLIVGLSKEGIRTNYFVHRLVAKAFIPNDDPINKPLINHKNEMKNDNWVDNLEWCSHQYNSTYGKAIEKQKQKRMKTVLQFDLNGNFINEYKSITEAGKQTGLFNVSIGKCCRNEQFTAGGFIWLFKIDSNDIEKRMNQIKNYIRTGSKPILKINKDTDEVIEEYKSIFEAGLKNNINKSNIQGCCKGKYGCKTAGGFKWKFK